MAHVFQQTTGVNLEFQISRFSGVWTNKRRRYIMLFVADFCSAKNGAKNIPVYRFLDYIHCRLGGGGGSTQSAQRSVTFTRCDDVLFGYIVLSYKYRVHIRLCCSSCVSLHTIFVTPLVLYPSRAGIMLSSVASVLNLLVGSTLSFYQHF